MRTLLACAAAIAILSACERGERDNPYEPGGEYQQRLDASGRRVVFRGADGELVGKLRIRDDRYKVYDSGLVPVGRISVVEDAEGQGDADAGGPEIALEVLALPSQKESRMTRRNGGVHEWPGRFRIEAVGQGWAIFDADADLVGYVDRADGEWTLRTDYSSAPLVRVPPAQREAIDVNARPVLAASRPVDGALLLAMGVEGLDPLERGVLGVWLRRVIGEGRPEE